MTLATNPELLCAVAQKKTDMAVARRGMKEGIKYSSRSLGGHTTQYRRLCRRAGITVRVSKTTQTLAYTVMKPCRYKACKGRSHKAYGEKCPIASARGKTGGEMGEGESKQRLGSENGNFRTVRECGCPVRQHRPLCSRARLIISPNVRLVEGDKSIREKANIRPISWSGTALTVAAVANYLRGVTGICAGCDESLPSTRASMVHRDDLMENPVRVICAPCDGC
jgi:hypothetical protein